MTRAADFIEKLKAERDAARKAYAETSRKLERVTLERDALRTQLQEKVKS